MRFPFRFKAKHQETVVVSPVSLPVSRALEKLQRFFAKTYNRYELYRQLELLDPMLQSAIDTAAKMTYRAMKGVTLHPGEKLVRDERELLHELRRFDHQIMKKYVYDAAYKLLRDGDVCYLIDEVDKIGVRSLEWLPSSKLTIIEELAHLTRFDVPVRAANFYVLNEVPSNANVKTQTFSKNKVLHINWQRIEEVRDIYNRYTYGVYTYPPLEALSTNIIWKFAVQANDMLLREVLVPREHHRLPSEPFNPDFFAGETYEDRVKNATKAAEEMLQLYSGKLQERRVDRGYVTLDNVEIGIVEPKLSYIDPNPLLLQLEKGIFASVGVPETAVTGATGGRASFASERVVGTYMTMKAEFMASVLAGKFAEVSRRHIRSKFGERFDRYLDEIEYKLQLVFFEAERARLAALISELGLFTSEEIRDMLGYAPLTEKQKEEALQLARRHTTSIEETAIHAKRRVEPEKPETEWTKAHRQVT